MSILINGMKMPKNCDDCFFIGRGYPDWCSFPQIPNGEDEIDDTKKRPDWCPLIELPEKHGDLIDINSKIEVQFFDEQEDEWSLETVTVGDYLCYASEIPDVVVEAEEDEG